MRVRSWRLPALGVAVAALVGLALVQGGPDAAAKPVAGAHAAYHGALAPEATLAPAIQYKRYYFTGTGTDELGKQLGTPTASFGTAKPTGGTAATQSASPLADDPESNPHDPLTAFWQGPFSGTLNGNVVFDWFWQSLNVTQALVAPTVEVSLWADPRLDGTATLIGRKQVDLATGPAPEVSEQFVPAKGTVANTLIIQVRPVYADSGEDLRVSYGSADFPSGFGIPTSAPSSQPTTRQTPANTATAYTGAPLDVQAVDVGTDAAEPTMGVEADGTAFYAAGKFPFANAVVVAAGLHPDLRRSEDGGHTWKSVQPKLPDGQTDSPPVNVDPYLYVDNDTGRVFTVDLYGACSYIHYSDDKGNTWQDSPFACGNFVDDHQTIVAGKPPAGITTSGYPNVLYYCINQTAAGSNCGRSTDGGTTWLPSGQAAFDGFDSASGGLCGGLHGHIVTDPQGRLFLPKGHCNHPMVAISEDAGATWTRVEVSNVRAADTQTSIASDTAGNLYYVFWDETDHLPYLTTSTDHGHTWTPARMIAPPGVKEVNFPSVDAGTPGRIAVSFPGANAVAPPPGPADPRDPTGLLIPPANTDFRPWNSYVVVSTDALSANPLFLSATANPPSDPIHRGACQGRCDGMWDFLDVVVAPSGEAWAAAVDDCIAPRAEGDPNCLTKTAPSADGDDTTGTYISAPGIAVRQVGGPTLRVAGQQAAAPGTPQAGGPNPVVQTPATGGAAFPAAGLAALALAVTLAELRRRSGGVAGRR